jgi:hypothetical protein
MCAALVAGLLVIGAGDAGARGPLVVEVFPFTGIEPRLTG